MNNQKRDPLPPILGLTIGVLASSTASIFIRFAQEGAASLVIAAYRVGIATLILGLILMLRKDVSISELKGSNRQLAAGAGAFLAVHFATWVSSLEYTTVASSVVLVSTSSLFVALLSPALLKEPINPRIKYALALSFIGTLVIAISDACLSFNEFQCPPIQSILGGDAIKGDFLALIGAISGAGYILIGRKVRGQTSLLPYITFVYGIAAIFLALFAALAGHQMSGFSPNVYIWFLLLAIFPQLVGHSSINWALRFLTAAFVSITLLGEPIGSSLLAFFILGEKPGWLMMIGSAFILIGIIIASFRAGQRRTALENEATSN